MKRRPVCKYVLIVEDDDDLRSQMAAVLEDEGYRVKTLENGQVALDYLLACTPDELPGCIVLDLMMPVMTGGEFLQKTQRDFPDTIGKIPIMVATAKGSPKQELKGLPAHVGRIRKPMEIDDFVNSVLEHCGAPGADKNLGKR